MNTTVARSNPGTEVVRVKEIKRLLSKDDYIRRLRYVKLYASPPFIEEVINKYLSKNEDMDRYIIESNNRLTRHLTEIEHHFDCVYLKGDI